MASGMGFLDRFRASVSSETRLSNELAALVGKNEDLVARLERHSAMTTYPNIKSGVEALAGKEAGHLKRLRAILSARNLWPRPPEPAAREGANNWERLSADLELLESLAAAFHRAAAEWEGVDQEVADALAAIALEDDENESQLRRLALKCDPQAID
jgi:hypothetical protein